MKRSVLTIAIAIGWASVALGEAAPAPLTSLRAIHVLSNDQAIKGLPVAFEGTVTYIRGYENTLFVQDGDVAIYVRIPEETKLTRGDRVLVEGVTSTGFAPSVVSNKVTLLGRGSLPKPIPTGFGELIRGERDCLLVTLRGVVRFAQVLAFKPGQSSIHMQVLTEGGYVGVIVDTNDVNPPKGMLDSEVEVTGVVSGALNGKMEQVGNNLYVSSLGGVKILKRATASPWSLPATPMDRILSTYQVHDLSKRIRVHGTITYYLAGSAVVMQDGERSLLIATTSYSPLLIGNEADATGFPTIRDGFLSLDQAEFQQSQIYAPIAPQPVTWQELASSRHLNDLVSIEGRVVLTLREAAQDEYVLVSGGYMFSAVYHRTGRGNESWQKPMKQVPVGSTIRVTGICSLQRSDAFNGLVPFNILMRTPDDIAIVAGPSLLNIRNLILVVCVLLLVVLAALVRGWALERQVRRQTAAMSARTEAEAALERRRSGILEDINGTRPLAEVIEQIAEMVTFTLNGAPCWCEIADGAKLGNCPQELNSQRVVRESIHARTGQSLGTLFVGFDKGTLPAAGEAVALHNGARLATLAIETRRLYSDLRHRSEFDLLTDIHNRFSLEKQIDALIEEARENAGIFGLIYIDLDEFKQVNDHYGHHIGDLYLQEAARRMKQQLRSHDLLARLGGDEFAVLLPKVRSRAGVEEIAQRLEHSFDGLFQLEGHTLQGSASFGIALYPQDTATRDGLLNVADTAMYAVKNSRKLAANRRVGREEPVPALRGHA